MLKKNSIPWPIRQFRAMDEKGKLNFEIAIQRKGNIWDIKRKSLLILSLLEGYPVPNMFAKFDGEVYSFIDGKQRMTCVLAFIKDEFALADNLPMVEGEDIGGKKFSELPEAFQKIINLTRFTVTIFENILDEQIEEMFFRLNNGVALKTIESTRVLLGTENMKTIESISNHPFFSNKASISKNRYTDQESAIQLVMLTQNKLTGFSSKELRSFVEGYRRNPFPLELIEQVDERLNYLDLSFNKKRKYLKKINLPMIYFLVDQAKQKEIPPEYFGLWADEFFKELDKESLYSQACQSGSAKKENVQIRLHEIESAFENSFSVYEKEEVHG